ncbi:MAG: ADP-ribosylation factor-like protein [Byssovorax sp.]
MASVNPLSRELVFKIVYYGPGLGGKTTTLEHIHATAKPEHRGKLVSLATPVDRTLYFDFLPMRLPSVRGMHIRLQLFTVPGQVYFNATRKLVLTGADGIVFVSDSQLVRADANLESLENLRENLLDQGRDLAQIPLIFQHNKRDLPDVLPVEELDSMLNLYGVPSLPTSATTGEGIYESLETISEQVLNAFLDRLPDSKEGAAPSNFVEVEGGLINAIRSATHRADSSADMVVAHIKAPGSYPSFPPEPSLSEPPPMPIPPPASIEGIDIDPLTTQRPLVRHGAAEAGVSFAELWPESERDTVHDVEEAIARGRYWRAIELCEALVSRVLTSSAGLFGSDEAPRDPAIVPMFLGLDGRRYLAFRSIVRDARGDGLITAREALTAYAFAVDARLAQSSIHHA